MGKLQALWQFTRFKFTQRFVGFAVPDQPHFDPSSLPAFETLLAGSKSYLEYGSGGSTLVAARSRIPTVTVECDRFYAAAVARRLPAESSHRMLVADIGITREWSYPIFRRPTPSRLRRWRRYVDLPYQTAGGTFPDLILVDGRFRRACALEAARQAQLHGATTTIFVDDYVGRSYSAIEHHLGTPRMAGRAAIFVVDRSLGTIDIAAVEEALRDPR